MIFSRGDTMIGCNNYQIVSLLLIAMNIFVFFFIIGSGNGGAVAPPNFMGTP